jgi:hypothetical protein
VIGRKKGREEGMEGGGRRDGDVHFAFCFHSSSPEGSYTSRSSPSSRVM